MTQNETSGKQLFEWVKGLPDFSRIFKDRVGNFKYQTPIISGNKLITATGIIDQECLYDQDGDLIEDSDNIQWLSPAQASTGKQLPTDEEIEEMAKNRLPDALVDKIVRTGYIIGMKIMRSLAQGDADNWIRVEERLPEIGEEVIVYCPGSERKPVTALSRLIRYEGATNFYWDNYYGGSFTHIQEAVTHWQPLPNAPITNNQK